MLATTGICTRCDKLTFRYAFASNHGVAYQRLRLEIEARIARLTLTADRLDVRALGDLASAAEAIAANDEVCLLYTSPSPRDS